MNTVDTRQAQRRCNETAHHVMQSLAVTLRQLNILPTVYTVSQKNTVQTKTLM